jgi:hypothetical protein
VRCRHSVVHMVVLFGGVAAVDGAVAVRVRAHYSEYLNASGLAFVESHRDFDSAAGVSGVSNVYLSFPAREVIYHAGNSPSEGSAK